jgi:HPt (histidine-containing phosphotransfer) domain-containing protein
MPRIIALTTDMSERSRAQIARAGIAKIVSKPVLLDALRAALCDDDEESPGELSPETSDDLIDATFLANQQSLLGVARLRSLQRLFDKTSADLMQTMAASAQDGNGHALARAAHQLGSAASALGLARLFARCTSLEGQAMSVAPESLASAAAELAALRRDSLAALDAHLRAPEASAALV